MVRNYCNSTKTLGGGEGTAFSSLYYDEGMKGAAGYYAATKRLSKVFLLTNCNAQWRTESVMKTR